MQQIMFQPKMHSCIVHLFAGIAMVTFGDGRQRSGQQSLAGDMLCLLSSFFYAAYTVAIRKMLPADDQANVSVFFGFIGMLNLIGMAPVLLLLWLTSAVQFHGVTAWLVFLAVCKGKLVINVPFLLASSHSAVLNMF